MFLNKNVFLSPDPNAVPVTLHYYSRSVTLDLGPQEGGAVLYKITCKDSNNQSCNEQTVHRAHNLILNVTFRDLKPYQEYMFVVDTQTQTLDGLYKNVTKMYSTRTSQAGELNVKMNLCFISMLHFVIYLTNVSYIIHFVSINLL